MATRKGKGRQAVRNNSGGFPAWAGILVGILIGALVVVVLMRHSLVPMAPKGPQPNPEATAQPGSDEGLAPAAGTTAPKKPQYDFYSVLSEKEVRIPDSEISAQAKAEQQQQLAAQQKQQAQPAAPTQQVLPANAPAAVTQNITAAPASAVAPPPPAAGAAAPTGYLLQVGAFPSAADAETLKAKLALQGFVANVQSVNVGGQTYHRVRLGPFHSATDLESAKQRLSAAGIPAIALKAGG
ncbi:SPOR domain-containing protein [Dyella caseinilytica]|uniref:SPOR domain-containing protein n=1 Tax=Dyella caseinilytica TaxID=1849581 RepID=A0ABX7GW30_9GAMM|nr:SPOR domain-containing protein [Dyella caseinilytica]QRN53937.1 SPOR domain-containing protein [Dyella caseinilytica]GFZ90243.1 sporulation protein [Dyella caseinilytica]